MRYLSLLITASLFAACGDPECQEGIRGDDGLCYVTVDGETVVVTETETQVVEVETEVVVTETVEVDTCYCNGVEMASCEDACEAEVVVETVYLCPDEASTEVADPAECPEDEETHDLLAWNTFPGIQLSYLADTTQSTRRDPFFYLTLKATQAVAVEEIEFVIAGYKADGSSLHTGSRMSVCAIYHEDEQLDSDIVRWDGENETLTFQPSINLQSNTESVLRIDCARSNLGVPEGGETYYISILSIDAVEAVRLPEAPGACAIVEFGQDGTEATINSDASFSVHYHD